MDNSFVNFKDFERQSCTMKHKWLWIVIPLAVMGILIVLVGPLAPLFEKLGVELKCIQGDWTDLQIVPCSSQSATPVTPLPAARTDRPIPIIVDDDGSPDGIVALLYFLRSPAFEVRAVTVSYGEAHPEKFASHVTQILAALGRADIPVGFGSEAPLAGTNAFPDSWRQASDEFWGIELPQGTGAVAPVPAAALMAEIAAASEQPVTIFISGSHTNLAEALRLDPGIAANIQEVYIMGGSVKVEGNIHSDWAEYDNTTAEWNIWVDPAAASEVFTAGLSLHLVPLDATRQVIWTKKDLADWKSSDAPESALAARLLQMMLDAWNEDGVYIWDLVAAIQTTFPVVCPETPYALEIVTKPGPDQGRTLAVEQSPNVSVCLNPDDGMIKALVAAAFQEP